MASPNSSMRKSQKALKFSYPKFCNQIHSKCDFPYRYSGNAIERFISGYKRYRALTPVQYLTLLLSMNTYQIDIN